MLYSSFSTLIEKLIYYLLLLYSSEILSLHSSTWEPIVDSSTVVLFCSSPFSSFLESWEQELLDMISLLRESSENSSLSFFFLKVDVKRYYFSSSFILFVFYLLSLIMLRLLSIIYSLVNLLVYCFLNVLLVFPTSKKFPFCSFLSLTDKYLSACLNFLSIQYSLRVVILFFSFTIY